MIPCSPEMASNTWPSRRCNLYAARSVEPSNGNAFSNSRLILDSSSNVDLCDSRVFAQSKLLAPESKLSHQKVAQNGCDFRRSITSAPDTDRSSQRFVRCEPLNGLTLPYWINTSSTSNKSKKQKSK